MSATPEKSRGRAVVHRSGNLLLRYLRRRHASLTYKLAIPALLGALLLITLGGSIGLAFLNVNRQAQTLIIENERRADATRLQIEVRGLMDTAQSALNNQDPNVLTRLFQQRSRLLAVIGAAGRNGESLPAEDRKRLAAIEDVIPGLDSMASLLQRGFPDTARARWDSEVYEQLAGAVSAAGGFQQNTRERSIAAARTALEAISLTATLSAVVLVLTLLALPLLGWLNHGLFVAPVQEVTAAMARVAAGDLAARVDLDRNDELGQLAGSFNDMTAALGIVLAARTQDGAAEKGGSVLLRSAHAAAGRAARTADELEQAYRIQSALLPPTQLVLPDWTVEAARIPATELGGDFFDLLDLPDGRLGLVIGDVSGHGAASALIAAWTQGMLTLAAAEAADPGQVLGRVNRLLYDRLPPRMFVTLAYAVLDPDRQLLEYANAGHPYPLFRGSADAGLPSPALSSDEVEGWRWLEVPGMPLGSVRAAQYKTITLNLDDIDSFMIYSDGIVEARDAGGEFYGFERLRETVAELVAVAGPVTLPSAAHTPDIILQRALDYAGTTRPEDDMTALVVRRGSPLAPVLALEEESAEVYLAAVKRS